MDKIERGCYYCKFNYNSTTHKHCPNIYKEGFNPCNKFEWHSIYKSYNSKKKK